MDQFFTRLSQREAIIVAGTNKRFFASRAIALFACVFCLGLGLVSACRADVVYTYDELGRVRSVTDATGNIAKYFYDQLGNITSIRRIASTQLAIIGFNPSSGPVGSVVTIDGNGFSPTISGNTVRFNNIQAVLSYASATRLIASVPSGATTGRISVTVGANTATSDEDFTVTTSANPPTITGFTPSCGPSNSTVTITGGNFDTRPNVTKVEFNGVLTPIDFITTTQITLRVPNSAGSSKWKVITPGGATTSADEFVVSPPGIACADMLAPQRIVIDGTATLTIPTAFKRGLVLFDGQPNDALSLDVPTITTNPSVQPVSVKLFAPNGAELTPTPNTLMGSFPSSIHFPALPRAGTYAVVFSPGNATATMTLNLRRNITLVEGASSTTSNITFGGQSLAFAFNAQPARLTQIAISRMDFLTTVNAQIGLYHPDGTNLTGPNTGCAGAPPCLFTVPVSVAGVYRVVVTPVNGGTGSVRAAFNPGTDLIVDGLSAQATIAAAGDQAWFKFTATAGQSMGLGISEITPNTLNGTVVVYGPNGGTAACGGLSGGCGFHLDSLSAGVYRVAFIFAGSGTGSAKVTLSSDLNLPADGAPRDFSNLRPGQRIRTPYSPTLVQTLLYSVANIATAPGGQPMQVRLVRANGTLYAQDPSVYAPGKTVLFSNVPVDNYAVTLSMQDGFGGTVTSVRAAFNPGPGDFTLDGPSVTRTLTLPGELAWLKFTLAAGQNVGLGLSDVAPATVQPVVTIYRPDGSQTARTCLANQGGCGFNLDNWPAGVYQMSVDLGATGTRAVTAALSSDLSLPADGIARNFALRPGQRIRTPYSPTLVADLAYSAGNIIPSKPILLSLVRTDGTFYSQVPFYNGTAVTHAVPVGSYLALLHMDVGSGGSVTNVRAAFNPSAIALPIDGATLPATTAVAGDAVWFQFTATAGQDLGLGISELAAYQAFTGPYATVHKPDGSVYLFSCNAQDGGCGAALTSLPAGLHRVGISANSPGTFKATLSNVFTGTLTLSAPFGPFSTRPGQSVRLTLAGAIGDLRRLTFSGLSFTPPSGSANLRILDPNLAQVASISINSTTTGFDVPQLLMSGTYTILIDPVNAAAFGMTITLVPR